MASGKTTSKTRPARLRNVRTPVPAAPPRTAAPVSVSPRPPRKKAAPRTDAALAPAPADRGAGARRASGDEALASIFAPLPEGWRHGWIGDSGTGKSFANKATIKAAIDRGLLCVAHDDTSPFPQVEGAIRETPDHLARQPLTEDEDSTGAVVFRGNVYRAVTVEVEDVAALAMGLGRRDLRVLLVVDELDRACTPGGQQLAAPSLRVALTQGRKLGLCVSWTTQSPQRAPKEVLDQATSIGIFRLGPRALNYVDERLYFDDDMLAVVPHLQNGEFVLFVAGRPWDRKIYRF